MLKNGKQSRLFKHRERQTIMLLNTCTLSLDESLKTVTTKKSH